MAGGLFILPGIICIMGLSYVYALWGQTPVVTALFFGLKAAVLAIVIEAVIRVGKKALHNGALVALAAAAFIGIFFFAVPFPVVIITAGLLGFAASFTAPKLLPALRHAPATSAQVAEESLLGDDIPDHARATAASALSVAATWLSLWLVPVAAIVFTLGAEQRIQPDRGVFSKMAMVTFGGAYAVLAYVAQQAVQSYGWLKPGEMLDGSAWPRQHRAR
jgi:chromate transporter